MKGTRFSVLQELEDWLHDEQGERFLCLYGWMGTGKSAIARTFAEVCFADGTLGASFFCSGGCDTRFILPTLAFRLAHRYPRFREELLKTLRENRNVGQESLDSQMEKLIVSPFEATQIRTLIIIDALYECDRQSVIEFLSSLSQHMTGIPNVKFFVTRRSGITDSGFYRGLQAPHPEKMIKLYRVERSLVDDDIKLILRAGLGECAKMCRDNRDYSLPRDWPNSHVIDSLCFKARGSLLCASEFVRRVVGQIRYPPHQYDLSTWTLTLHMNKIYNNLECKSSGRHYFGFV